MLINVTGGTDMSIMEINEAANLVMESADSEANIIFGAGIDETLKDEVRITVIATGFEKTPFPTREKKKARTATPYGAAVPSFNPYENRPRAEASEQQGFDAPAPATYESDSSFFPGGARPVAAPAGGYQAPYVPQQPYTQPAYQQPFTQQPAAQPYPQQTYQAPAQPAANARDDLGVPAFLRRSDRK